MALHIETFEITPFDEECPQVGSEGYSAKAKATADVLIEQLKRTFDLNGVCIEVVEVPHDLGSYFELEASVSDDDVEATTRLIRLGQEFPDRWDSVSKVALATI